MGSAVHPLRTRSVLWPSRASASMPAPRVRKFTRGEALLLGLLLPEKSFPRFRLPTRFWPYNVTRVHSMLSSCLQILSTIVLGIEKKTALSG